MPSAWPSAALRAQAVAARTYALRGLQPSAPFDVYSDVRSQVYLGLTGESVRGRQAVNDTRKQVLYYGREFAQTYFFSSSGGRTAAIDEEWGGPPVPYLQPVADPYDTLSPYHSWAVTLSNAEVQRRLGGLVAGDLTGIAVTARNSSGRVATVTITGTGGVTQATGSQVRTALGLRSTWFYLTLS
jgi:stage II sporulation protein D